MRLWSKDDVLSFLRKYKFVLLIAFLGLILILIPVGKKDKTPTAEDTAEVFAFDAEEIEERLEEALSYGEGVGRVKVLLTLESSSKTVYVTEGSVNRSEGNMDERTEITKISSSGGEQPLVRENLSPEYRGALILCDGAGDPRVRLWVTEAVSALLGLSSDRISVVRMAQ
ncbi:MAG: hypothetical protein IKX85_05185 [Clostridia bacterium]|nr:hypothetical protein [Clostridia bacterium]